MGPLRSKSSAHNVRQIQTETLPNEVKNKIRTNPSLQCRGPDQNLLYSKPPRSTQKTKRQDQTSRTSGKTERQDQTTRQKSKTDRTRMLRACSRHARHPVKRLANSSGVHASFVAGCNRCLDDYKAATQHLLVNRQEIAACRHSAGYLTRPSR